MLSKPSSNATPSDSRLLSASTVIKPTPGRLVSGFDDSEQLYVLPATVSGQNCFRVVWGLFDSQESAEQGIAAVPAGIRAGDVSPVALSRILR